MKPTKLASIIFFIFFSIVALSQFGIALGSGDETRDVESISSTKTKTLTKPKLKTTRNGFKITYAQASIGFDAGCNPNRIMSKKLNECIKLPKNVKQMAISYCADKDKNKAVFYGNTENFIKMTVSRFRCEQDILSK